MRTVTVRLIDLNRVTINLGVVGENEHSRIKIDRQKAFDEYPTAIPSLAVKNPNGDKYPVVVTRDGNYVRWDVANSDLVYDGDGEIQLAFTVDSVVAKTYVGKTKIGRSIIPSGTTPTPIANFIEQAETILGEVRDAIPSGGDEGQVLAKKSDSDYDLEWVDQTGGGGTSDYSELTNKPKINNVTLKSGNNTLADLGIAAASDIPSVSGKADKVSGATDNNFAALDSNGNLKDSGHKHSDYLTSHQDISGKADKVSSAVNGNFAGLDSNGNLTDSGKKASDFATPSDVNAKYTKPGTGIPSSDMASAVQTSLGKADTAYQMPSGGIPSTDLASGVLISIIDDTAGDGDTNKVWSADKLSDLNSALTQTQSDVSALSTSVNLLNLANFVAHDHLTVSGVRIKTDGKPTDMSSYDASPFIPVKEGYVIKFGMHCSDIAAALAFYTTNEGNPEASHVVVGTGASAITSGDYTVPSDGYIRFCSSNSYSGEYLYFSNFESDANKKLIHDVQLNGTSVSNNGISNIPIASVSNLGVVKVSGGLYIGSSGGLQTNRATTAQIKEGTNVNNPITPSFQEYSAFFGLAKASGDTTQAASANDLGIYTDGAKRSIQNMFGLTDDLTLIEAVAEKKSTDNLFDNNFDESGYIDDANGDKASNNFKRTSTYYPIDDSNTTLYSYNQDSGGTTNLLFYTSEKVFISRVDIAGASTSKSIPTGAAYFRIYRNATKTGNITLTYAYAGHYIPYRRWIAIKDNCVGYNALDADAKEYANPLYGKKILAFGDSIWGNDRTDGIADFLTAYCHATVYNGAVGGTRIVASRTSQYDAPEYLPFDGENLIHALMTNTWTDQDANASSVISYVASSTLPMLKALDVSTIDVITIAYGHNDITSSETLVQIQTALAGVIDDILSHYPHIRIVVITPPWRTFSSGTVDGDLYESTSGMTLRSLADGLISTAKTKHITSLDMLGEIPLCANTAGTYMDTDKVHLNAVGNALYAHIVHGKLRSMY